MNIKAFPIALILLSTSLGALGCAGGSPKIDMGDGSSGGLVWGTIHYGFERQDRDRGIAYADKLVELYGDEARSQQASLSDYPSTDPPEETYRYATLNNVAFGLLGKAALLRENGDLAGARESCEAIIREYSFGQLKADSAGAKKIAPDMPRDAQGFVKLGEVAEWMLADLGER